MSLPYIANVVGPYNFGILSICLILIQICFVFSEWGFSVYAIEKISSSKNKKKIGKYVSSIYSLKLFFSLISIFILSILFFSGSLSINNSLFIATLLTVFFGSFNALWFYQAINDVSLYLYFTIIGRIIFLISIFFLVSTPNDLHIAIYSQSFFFIILTVSSFTHIYLKHCKISLVKKIDLISTFRDTKHFFAASLIQNQLHIVWGFGLIFFATPIQVGFFNLADQLLKAGAAISNIFPEYLLSYFRRNQIAPNISLMYPYFIFFIIALILSMSLAPILILNFLDDGFINIINIIIFTIISWFFISITKLLGYPYLGIHFSHLFVNHIYYHFLFSHIFFAFLWIIFFDLNTTNLSIFFLLTNLFNFLYMLYILYKNKFI